MARILFTTLPSNDLGLPTRLLPVANALAGRGHEVAFCNPLPAPAALIGSAGFANLPIPVRRPAVFAPPSPEFWDLDHLAALAGWLDVDYVRASCADHLALLGAYRPDVVVDSLNPAACVAARALHLPLVTLGQGDMHPASGGFLWWRERPAEVPSPAAVANAVLAEHGLPPVRKVAELLVGDRTLIVGTPDTDPLPPGADVTYVGPLLWEPPAEPLPPWVDAHAAGLPLVWLYPGNPRYGPRPTRADSVAVLEAGLVALADIPARVVVTSGYQTWPGDLPPLPANTRHAPYLSGPALAARSALLVHHGGHSSYLTGLAAGTPAVVVPTFTERESPARRLAALGAGRFVLPSVLPNGEKRVSVAGLREAVLAVLADPSYAANARRIAEAMRGYDGVVAVADIVEEIARGGTTRTTSTHEVSL